VKYIYKGSLYPTLGQILSDYDAAPKPVSFKEMKKIKKMKTRWATIFKTYPMCVMTETDLFTFDNLEND
jgi:hypothetical protein